MTLDEHCEAFLSKWEKKLSDEKIELDAMAAFRLLMIDAFFAGWQACQSEASQVQSRHINRIKNGNGRNLEGGK